MAQVTSGDTGDQAVPPFSRLRLLLSGRRGPLSARIQPSFTLQVMFSSLSHHFAHNQDRQRWPGIFSQRVT